LAALGIDIVASAGNDNVSQETWPAARFIGVGSINPREERSCFSNYGPWVDHWVIGEEVLGELPPGSDGQVEFEIGPVTWSGTSFAAPQVAASKLASEEVSSRGGDRTPGETARDDPDYGC
jgi:subtilisin family serine protease